MPLLILHIIINFQLNVNTFFNKNLLDYPLFFLYYFRLWNKLPTLPENLAPSVLPIVSNTSLCLTALLPNGVKINPKVSLACCVGSSKKHTGRLKKRKKKYGKRKGNLYRSFAPKKRQFPSSSKQYTARITKKFLRAAPKTIGRTSPSVDGSGVNSDFPLRLFSPSDAQNRLPHPEGTTFFPRRSERTEGLPLPSARASAGEKASKLIHRG